MVVGEAVTEESGLKHKLLNGLCVPSRGHLQVLRPCPPVSSRVQALSLSWVWDACTSPLSPPRPELGEVQYRSKHKTYWLSNFKDPRWHC